MKKILLLLIAVTLVGCNAPKFDTNQGPNQLGEKLDQMIKERAAGAVDVVQDVAEGAADVAGDAVDATINVAGDAVDATGNTIEATVDAAEEVVEEVIEEAPSVDIPSVDDVQAASDAIAEELINQPIIIIE